MNIYEAIRKHLEQNEAADAEELARKLIHAVEKHDLLPLLTNEIKQRQRRDVRVAEIALLQTTTFPRQARTLLGVKSALADLAPLLDRVYRIGDGQARRFGSLTIREHRVRIEMLRAHLNGLQASIALHERAIMLCTEYGVERLDDLETAEAEASAVAS